MKKDYDKRQRVGAWLWWIGPAGLVALALYGYYASPVEDGVELEPTSQADIVLEKQDDGLSDDSANP